MDGRLSSKEKIMRSATELFYRVGYQTTSVDDILRHCGVAKSNFYYHFKTKEQLAFAVIELRMAEQEALFVQSLQNRDLTPGERLSQLFVLIHRTQADIQNMAGCPFGNFAAALPSTEDDAGSERFRQRLSQCFQHMETTLRDCLAEGTGCGDFRTDIAAADMATFAVATMQGLLILTKTYRDTTPLVRGFAVLERLLQDQ